MIYIIALDPLRYYQYRGGIFLFITIAAEDVHMTSVASWYVDAYKIPYGVQEVRNNSESVLVEGFDALILVGNVLVVRRTDEGPVSAALVQDYAEELVYIRVLESGIHQQDVVLYGFIYLAHDSCLAVK